MCWSWRGVGLLKGVYYVDFVLWMLLEWSIIGCLVGLFLMVVGECEFVLFS